MIGWWPKVSLRRGLSGMQDSDEQKIAAPPKGAMFVDIDVKTLFASAGVAVFLFGVLVTFISLKTDPIRDEISSIGERVSNIPTKGELGSEIEKAAAEQRLQLEKEANQLRQLSSDIDKRLAIASLQSENVTRQVERLEKRLENTYTDNSDALIQLLNDLRQPRAPSNDAAGGPLDIEVELEDYAIGLIIREDGKTFAQAKRFVDRAFERPEGAEAARLFDLAQKAKQSRSTQKAAAN
jgi:TolA-binding protein